MKTKLVFSGIIPFSGFLAMTVWPFIFVRKEAADRYSTVVNNHEHIHAEQQKEMLLVGIILTAVMYGFIGLWALLFLPIFFLWYGLEWVLKIPVYGSSHKAYRNISFEREAYQNEKDLTYLVNRRRFIWLKYIFHN